MIPTHEVFSIWKYWWKIIYDIKIFFRRLGLSIKQKQDKIIGTLPSSDPESFPLHEATNLPGTRSTLHTLTNPVQTPYPNIRNNSDETNTKNSSTSHSSDSPAITNIFPPIRSLSYPSCGLPSAQKPSSTPLHAAPQIDTLKPQIPSKNILVKPLPITHKTTPTVTNFCPYPSMPTSLFTSLNQSVLVTFTSKSPRRYHTETLSQHMTIPSTDELLYSVITQLLTFVPPNSQVPSSQNIDSSLYPQNPNMCSFFSSLTNFWWYWLSLPSRKILDWFWNSNCLFPWSRTYKSWKLSYLGNRRLALADTSFECLASSYTNCLCETGEEDLSVFSTTFQAQFECNTINFTAQAEAQNIQLITLESISYQSCHDWVTLNKGMLGFNSIVQNCINVKLFIQGFPFKWRGKANEKDIETVIPFQSFEIHINRIYLSYEVTPKYLVAVHYPESEEC